MTQRVMGALKPKKDIRDYKLKKIKIMSVEYPESFECERLTSIKNQGSVGSCVAHSTAEILEHHAKGEVRLSTNFIYGIHNKLYGSKGPGMYLREACKIVHNYGDPEYEYCKGNTEVESVYEIANKTFEDEDAMNNASKHRISSFARLFSKDDIKYSLMNYGPVLSSIMWYLDNKVSKGVLVKGTEKDGGHAIMIRGWNAQGWICQNSWGTSWGDKGYFILPYDYNIMEAYSFVPDTDSSDIVKPSNNKFIDFLCKIINFFLNLFV